MTRVPNEFGPSSGGSRPLSPFWESTVDTIVQRSYLMPDAELLDIRRAAVRRVLSAAIKQARSGESRESKRIRFMAKLRADLAEVGPDPNSGAAETILAVGARIVDQCLDVVEAVAEADSFAVPEGRK